MDNSIIDYKVLLKQAFIDPIRTVTVIDDEYPTMTSLLNSNSSFQPSASIDRLKSIINMCHNDHMWSVDVFDGKSPNLSGSTSIPSHLNHSDLIILDYHLDGDDAANGGDRARQIIKDLDVNTHYNLIIVHTKGSSSGDIRTVFQEILINLLHIADVNHLSLTQEIKDNIDDWAYVNGSEYGWINENFSAIPLLKYFITPSSVDALAFKKEKHFFYRYKEDIIKISNDSGFTRDDLIKWKFNSVLNELDISRRTTSRGDISWEWDDTANFISTSKVFITVIRKDTDISNEKLYESLGTALEKFNAPPMHLIMAKMRHELDERGIEQAIKITENRFAQAGWLYNLLQHSEDPFSHDKAIDLHWEQLARASRNNLRDFSQKIAIVTKAKFPTSNKDAVTHFFSDCMHDKDKDNVLGHLNAFSCSMGITNNHLTTGTIFRFDNDYWVCLTPACDLVPGQKETWADRIGENHLVFKAVKLNNIELPNANRSAFSNENVYLLVENKILTFSFKKGNANPVWDTFYVENNGKFEPGNKLTLCCIRERKDVDTTSLALERFDAEGVAELRYEYALNLLHKLSNSLSRVGLDFVGSKSIW